MGSSVGPPVRLCVSLTWMGVPRWAAHTCLSGEACAAGSCVLLLFTALEVVVRFPRCSCATCAVLCVRCLFRAASGAQGSLLRLPLGSLFFGRHWSPLPTQHHAIRSGQSTVGCPSLLACAGCWLDGKCGLRCFFSLLRGFVVCLSVLPAAPACCVLDPCHCWALASQGCVSCCIQCVSFLLTAGRRTLLQTSPWAWQRLQLDYAAARAGSSHSSCRHRPPATCCQQQL